MSLKKIKQEADCPDYNSADEGQGAAELRDRARKMTRRIAGGAGFSRGQRDGEMGQFPRFSIHIYLSKIHPHPSIQTSIHIHPSKHPSTSIYRNIHPHPHPSIHPNIHPHPHPSVETSIQTSIHIHLSKHPSTSICRNINPNIHPHPSTTHRPNIHPLPPTAICPNIHPNILH
ncbi:unnamed protein product [Pleuronectes platessa]|uniref:Uncharacterized protein n=1 Tax=Pleuronectes platessa TaxID=8262 RepID=A0A9N7ZE65_PLEPL|nr:unnamed protein product [Pleuronectes platessa]